MLRCCAESITGRDPIQAPISLPGVFQEPGRNGRLPSHDSLSHLLRSCWSQPTAADRKYRPARRLPLGSVRRQRYGHRMLPDFDLIDQAEKPWRLSEHLDSGAMLVFLRGDW